MPSTGTLGKEAVLTTTGTNLEPFRDIIDRFGLLLGQIPGDGVPCGANISSRDRASGNADPQGEATAD